MTNWITSLLSHKNTISFYECAHGLQAPYLVRERRTKPSMRQYFIFGLRKMIKIKNTMQLQKKRKNG